MFPKLQKKTPNTNNLLSTQNTRKKTGKFGICRKFMARNGQDTLNPRII